MAFEVFLFDRGRFVGSRIFSGDRQVRVGRAIDASLRLEDPLVSGRHAVLFVKDGGLHIADEDSSNGIFVNGKRVSTTPIGALDEIRLGGSRIKVEILGAADEEEIPGAERTHSGLELPASVFAEPQAPSQPPSIDVSLGPMADAARASAPPTSGRMPDAVPLPGVKVAKPPRGGGADIAAMVRETQEALSKESEVGALVAVGSTGPNAQRPPATGDLVAAMRETGEAFGRVEEGRAPPAAVAAPSAADASSSDLDSLPYPDAPVELDEEAEEERRFVPAFSLLEAVVVEDEATGGAAVAVVEVIRHRGDRLVDAARVEGGGTYDLIRGEDGKPWRMLQVLRKGRLRLFFREGDEGSLLLGGKKTSLQSLCDPAHLFHKKRGIYAVDIQQADRAQLWIDGAGYFVRWAMAPLQPPKSFSFRVAAEDRRYLLTGVAGIVLMLVGIWVQSLLAPPELLVMEQAEFAEISLKDLEMEKPPEPEPEIKPPEPVAEVQAPEPEPEPEPEPTPQPAKPAPAPRSRPVARAAATANPKPSAPAPTAADNALAALADIIPAGDTKLTAAVSNIAAVRVPTGTSSTFQVSGAIGKVPGDEVTLSRGGKAGGEGRETRAAAAVLAGKSVGQVGGGGGKGAGTVRGTVARQPSRSVGTAGGSLDRGAILKVINSGIAEVQSCYERQLMSNPGLQGKVVFDWVISPQGSVASTRVRSSSLASQAVATCIASVIKSWRFPEPTGGSVTVTFPFVFSVQGF